MPAMTEGRVQIEGLVGAGFKPALAQQAQAARLHSDRRQWCVLREGGFETRPYKTSNVRAASSATAGSSPLHRIYEDRLGFISNLYTDAATFPGADRGWSKTGRARWSDLERMVEVET
jgi:hypothetical protein